MTEQDRINIRKLQATLTKISVGEYVFFNVAKFEELGLVKAHGRDSNNRTKWILTPKSKQFLNVVV